MKHLTSQEIIIRILVYGVAPAFIIWGLFYVASHPLIMSY